ncbi:unnamed protein product, partial [Ascophyllum nodosum]
AARKYSRHDDHILCLKQSNTLVFHASSLYSAYSLLLLISYRALLLLSFTLYVLPTNRGAPTLFPFFFAAIWMVTFHTSRNVNMFHYGSWFNTGSFHYQLNLYTSSIPHRSS